MHIFSPSPTRSPLLPNAAIAVDNWIEFGSNGTNATPTCQTHKAYFLHAKTKNPKTKNKSKAFTKRWVHGIGGVQWGVREGDEGRLEVTPSSVKLQNLSPVLTVHHMPWPFPVQLATKSCKNIRTFASKQCQKGRAMSKERERERERKIERERRVENCPATCVRALWR